ncbi:MAG: 3-dehydroquinate synthase [Candidatus Gracilibacteria bacterium]
MNQINVDIKQNNIKYKILFSSDILVSIKENIENYEKKRFLFVVDSKVYSLYKEQIDEKIIFLKGKIIVLSNGERNKNMKSVFKIIDKLMELSFTRKDYVVSIGGGVTGDITAFACSLFKRGINLIQVPTTLLSMFDSSVGGKTGVDYLGVKNGIGTFYNPTLVLVDIKFLQTLVKKELVGGYFEGLKHAILLGKQDFEEYLQVYDMILSKSLDKNIEKIVAKNIKCKLDVVKSDPTEINGKRRVLNYGHTFGHALETYLNFKLGHGICVAFGLIYANLLSYKLGFLKVEVYERIEDFIKSKIKNIKLETLDFEEIYKFMQNDKKNENSSINFILLKDFGKVFEYKATKEELKDNFLLFSKGL